MEIEKAREFISRNHQAVLTTYYADGRAQMTPVTAGVDGDGHVVISARDQLVKVRNAERDPRVVLCVLPDSFYGEWVYVEGTAEVLRLPEAMEPLVDYYRRISGEHPDWDDYRAAMERDKRLLLRITISRAGPG
ncbi:PPOX class F420-dependent oxidoreductase [Phytohabitans flavus]|uniref:PPOX class F420-dependent enzyme n=1 Tax=Phytohabitans flavus TaxID=1076124 RepID=A0A6F8Y0H2_9ACTN|nr:PPOX class F420-dependent oxidoreductase [Phytohabitans flavus]BCB79560.1 PPOX class F420-dependent enzyme [Phytohabitans flavus]